MYFVMLPCYLIVLGAYAFSMNYIAKPNGFLLLGVKIPKEEMKNPKVLEIVRWYKRKEKWIIIAMLFTTLTAFFVRNYGIISCIYCIAWVFLWLGLIQLLFFQSYDKLYAYKKTQGWVVGEPCSISVDTEVARLKSKFFYPKWHWGVITVLTLAGSYLWLPEDREVLSLYVYSGVNVLLTIVLLGLYTLVSRVKTTVYSESTEINVALNQCYCHELTKAIVFAAYMNAVSWLIGGLFPNPQDNLSLILWIVGISSVFICVIIFCAFYRVQKERRIFEQTEAMNAGMDDDIYWRGGLYANPNDPKLWVEKRNGIGMQMNGAHPAAKVIDFLVTITVIGLFAFLIYDIPLDFPKLSLDVEQDTLYVNATRYDCEIPFNEIERAQVITELPKLYKNSGLANGTYDFGKFRAKEYGQSQVYINRNQPEFLLLYAGEKNYLINSDKEEELKECLLELQQRGLLESRRQ